MIILVYGFKPYDGYRENITETIVNKIRERKGLVKMVFPVRFRERMYMDKVLEIKPDLVLGLGQHPNGHKIRIERRSANLKQSTAQGRPKRIIKGGPLHRMVNFKLGKDAHSRVSYDAGTYVCNFSMYVFSGHAAKKGTRFAFLHIPKDYDIRRAVKFVESRIKEMTDAKR